MIGQDFSIYKNLAVVQTELRATNENRRRLNSSNSGFVLDIENSLTEPYHLLIQRVKKELDIIHDMTAIEARRWI